MTDEVETFDIAIEDVEPGEYAAMLGGLGQVVVGAAQLDMRGHEGAGKRAVQIGEFTERIMRENPEATRASLLGADGEFLRAVSFPEHLLDEFDLEVIDGEFVDARDITEIDVE